MSHSASTTRTIKFNSRTGTYTALIMCPDGDLYQEYEGTEPDISVYPNFEETQPKLNFVCMSSRSSEGLADVSGMTYWFNGTEIKFGSNGISIGTFAGVFKKFSSTDDGNLYPGLQILKNIAAISGYASASIKMEGMISYGTLPDTIQATYTIPIQQAKDDSDVVAIVAGDSNSFVIREKGGSCILKAMAYQNHNEISANKLKYKWYKLATGEWSVIDDQTNQTLTVKESDVNTYGDYKVEVYLNGTFFGQDVQGVMDVSDPYEINPCPVPADECISEDESGNDKVTYTPKVVTRGTNVVAATGVKFYFVARDGAGNFLNTETTGRTTPLESFAVTREMCKQSTGDVSVTITSEDF